MEIKKLSLALQGGGAHGAFTWGVLDRLLQEPTLEIEAVVGTSAGAMNAAVMTYGIMVGGKEGARKKLDEFWKAISEAAKLSILQPNELDKLLHPGDIDYNPGFWMFEWITENFAPHQFNPMKINPLQNILESVIDFQRLRTCSSPSLFVCATNVYKCQAKVFHTQEMIVEMLLASACLPYLFEAVEINGEAYWDGGFMGNPPLFPLLKETKTNDILIVQINPIKIHSLPTKQKEIRDRINEISFNCALIMEMQILDFKNKLVEKGIDLDGELRKVNVHNISADQALANLGFSSKLNSSWDFLVHLKEIGRRYASEWLEFKYPVVGQSSSCSVLQNFRHVQP